MVRNDGIFRKIYQIKAMKKALFFLFLMIMGLSASIQLAAQCIPDTVHCVDTTGNPGEICPPELPNAGLNALYDETVTIIPPGSYPLWGQEFTVFYMHIDSLINLPPGIDYYPNADTFFADTAYCIQLNGTPTETGKFNLFIYISALIDFGGIPTIARVVDSTSISITVVEEVGLDLNRETVFRVIPNVPNPFSESTRLTFYTPFYQRVELSVYNVLGSRVHWESFWSAAGTHSFSFTGNELPPGPYFYRVTIRGQYLTGKMMKSR